MDDDSLRKFIAEIDKLPHDGEPRSHLSIGKPPCYVFLTANREGLVSLARALLKAAISPKTDVETFEVTRIEEPHLQVMKTKDDVAIGWIEHADIVLTRRKTSTHANGRPGNMTDSFCWVARSSDSRSCS